MQEIERKLFLAARDGDMDAYEDLQLILEPDVRRFVRRLRYDPFSEDDILQDVFIAFFRNMHAIDPVESMRPYLFRIARNRCYDSYRRESRYETMSLDDDPVQMRVAFTEAHRTPKPDDVTHWMLLHLEVREAIDQLPESQRLTLILFSEEGLSYAEIAEVMDTSVGTVKSRLYYAKKNLRGLLRPETAAVLDEEFGIGDKSSNTTKAVSEGDETSEVDEDERLQKHA